MNDLALIAQQVGAALLARSQRLVVAESCTGGWVAKTLTDIAGSSQWFERGFITYSNESKQEMLGVQGDTLETHGAVSEETVVEMAQGALDHSPGDLSLAISGIAGPGGSIPGKTVGTVCFAWMQREQAVRCSTQYFDGDRESIRRQSVYFALQGVLNELQLYEF